MFSLSAVHETAGNSDMGHETSEIKLATVTATCTHEQGTRKKSALFIHSAFTSRAPSYEQELWAPERTKGLRLRRDTACHISHAEG